MRSQIELLAGLAIVMLTAGVFLLYRANRGLQLEVQRGNDNLVALTRELDTTRDAHGRAVAETHRLRITIDELESNRKALSHEVKKLGIQLKRILAIARTATETATAFEGRIDTVYIIDTARSTCDTLQRLRYEDPYTKIAATIDSAGYFIGEVQTIDTLYQVVHRVPYRFWCFKWGTKGIRQTIRSSNPNTRIVYSEYIAIER